MLYLGRTSEPLKQGVSTTMSGNILKTVQDKLSLPDKNEILELYIILATVIVVPVEPNNSETT